MDLFGHREVTLESDTEPAITPSTTEDAVKGDKPSNGLIEKSVCIVSWSFAPTVGNKSLV